MSEKSPESGQAGVEITPAMIEAGVGVLLCYHRERSDEKDVVREIFARMVPMWKPVP